MTLKTSTNQSSASMVAGATVSCTAGWMFHLSCIFHFCRTNGSYFLVHRVFCGFRFGEQKVDSVSKPDPVGTALYPTL